MENQFDLDAKNFEKESSIKAQEEIGRAHV
jgi:hypothetical protein